MFANCFRLYPRASMSGMVSLSPSSHSPSHSGPEAAGLSGQHYILLELRFLAESGQWDVHTSMCSEDRRGVRQGCPHRCRISVPQLCLSSSICFLSLPEVWSGKGSEMLLSVTPAHFFVKISFRKLSKVPLF